MYLYTQTDMCCVVVFVFVCRYSKQSISIYLVM